MRNYSMAMQGKHGAQNAVGQSYAARGMGLTYDPWTNRMVDFAVPYKPTRLVAPGTQFVRGMGQRAARTAVRRVADRQRRSALLAAKAIYKKGGAPVLSAAVKGVRTPSCAVWGTKNCLPGWIATWHSTWGFCYCRNPRR